MVIVFGSGKGGGGKTTISLNVTACLSHQGHDVVLLDADRQLSCRKWAEDREHDTECLPIQVVDGFGNIAKTIEVLDKNHDIVIVDTAGFDSAGGRNVELRSAMRMADVVIIPCRPSQLDVDRLDEMALACEEVRHKFNSGMKAKVVISAVPIGLDVVGLKKSIEHDYPEFEVCKVSIYDRHVYRTTLVDGSGVWDWNGQDYKQAQKEISLLAKEITTDDSKSRSKGKKIRSKKGKSRSSEI